MFILMGCDEIWEKFSNKELCDMVEDVLNYNNNG